MENKAWVLRTCNADGTSHNGFKWPSEIGSIVKCDDWKPTEECGNGLHGLLDGLGDFALLSDSPNAIWQVVEVDRDKCIELNGKVKFEECKLVYSGNMVGASTLLIDYQMKLMMSKGEVVDDYASQLATSGKYSQLATSGDYGQLATSGDYGQLATSGYNSKLASSGNNSKLASSGNNSKLASSGDYGQLAASGYNSKLASSGFYSQLASSGDYSKLASSGFYGQLAASGDYSRLAASGDYGQFAASGYNSRLASSGNNSRLSASGKSSIVVGVGLHSVASAADKGCIVLSWWNDEEERYEIEVGHIGKNGLKSNTFYELDENHKFVELD